jgi:hypothetical protein
VLLGDGAEPGDLSLIAEMLSLSGGERFPPLDLSPQRKKERTLAALFRQLQALAPRQPMLMIFEDLHWIDPASARCSTSRSRRSRARTASIKVALALVKFPTSSMGFVPKVSSHRTPRWREMDSNF